MFAHSLLFPLRSMTCCRILIGSIAQLKTYPATLSCSTLHRLAPCSNPHPHQTVPARKACPPVLCNLSEPAQHSPGRLARWYCAATSSATSLIPCRGIPHCCEAFLLPLCLPPIIGSPPPSHTTPHPTARYPPTPQHLVLSLLLTTSLRSFQLGLRVDLAGSEHWRGVIPSERSLGPRVRVTKRCTFEGPSC